MNNFQIEIINPNLVRKGIAAINEFYRCIAIDQLEISGLNVFATGVDSPFLNVVLDARQHAQNSPELMSHIADFFKKHAVPWAWISMPLTNNNLRSLGLTLLEETPSFYFNLNKLSMSQPEKFLVIKEAGKNDDLSDWIKPIQEGFPSNDHCEKYRLLNLSLLQKGESRLRHFVAYYKNEAVSAGTLFLANESIMIHNLATKIEFQRKGFGTTLTLHMMQEAKKIGFVDCFLDSSVEGLNLYQRMGFKIYGTCLAYGTTS